MYTVVQSAIKEVRDQIMLDTADGEYLNNVGQNLGVQRPPFGFTDNTWRAVVKLLAVHYKQVKTKFEEILAVLYGPKISIATVLDTSAAINDVEIFIKDTSHFPQIGTLVLDEGLATEETVSYTFIDRDTNKVVLASPLTQNHIANVVYADKPLLFNSVVGSTSFVVSNANPFSQVPLPFSLLVDAGQASEEVVSVTAVNTSTRTLTTSATTFNHDGVTPSTVQTSLAYDYVRDTYMLSLTDSSKFPEEGVVIASMPPSFTVSSGTTTSVIVPPGLSSPGQHVGKTLVFLGNVTGALTNVARTVLSNNGTTITFAATTSPAPGDVFYIANTFAASAGSTSTVTVGSTTFITGDQVGNQVVFVGNVTSSLRGVSVNVASNTATVLTFTNTITAPAVGDLFYIRPRVEYSRNSYNDHALILRKNISSLMLPGGTLIELLNKNTVVQTSQIKSTGIGWDVIQSSPRDVDILLPNELNIGNLRTSSYIHNTLGTTANTTTTANVGTNTTTISVASNVTFPFFGVVTINAVNYGYAKIASTVGFVAAGSTTTVLNISPNIAVNSISNVFIKGVSYPVTSNTTNTITLTTPLKNNIFTSLVNGDLFLFYSNFTLELQTGLTAPSSSGDAVVFYEPTYLNNVVNGNVWNIPDTWPGPYVYDSRSDIPVNLSNITTLTSKLAGPTRLVVDQSSFNNTLEVTDASFFPLSGYPIRVRLGSTTGNLETAEVTDVNLMQRVGTTIAAPNSIGDSFVQVTALGSPGGSRFPNSRGYRVLVGRGTANEEVIYVLSTDGVSVPPRLICEPLTRPHANTETVELLADLITVANIGDVHDGHIAFTDRKTRWPTSITSNRIIQSESVEILYDEIPITSSAGFALDNGTLTINYINEYLYSNQTLPLNIPIGSNSVTVNDTSYFPTTGYPYPVILGDSTVNQEIMFVSNNNVGTATLTFSTNTRKSHAANDRLIFNPGKEERFTYSSISGNLVRFANPIVLRYNHYIGESVVATRSFISTFKINGYDFPLRIPQNPALQLEYLIDLVRAAGVKVTVIYAR